MGSLVKEFTGEDDFAAMRTAESFLTQCGFSFGSTERGWPRCIMFGDYSIAKWRNLTETERRACHGKMSGEMRRGPVRIEIFESAPQEAKRAFHAAATSMAT